MRQPGGALGHTCSGGAALARARAKAHQEAEDDERDGGGLVRNGVEHGGLIVGSVVVLQVLEAVVEQQRGRDDHVDQQPRLQPIRSTPRTKLIAVRLLAVAVHPSIHPPRCARRERRTHRGEDEGEERAVVAQADGGAHPRAVVVEALDAVVGHAAVVRPRRLVKLAGLVVADLHLQVRVGRQEPPPPPPPPPQQHARATVRERRSLAPTPRVRRSRACSCRTSLPLYGTRLVCLPVRANSSSGSERRGMMPGSAAPRHRGRDQQGGQPGPGDDRPSAPRPQQRRRRRTCEGRLEQQADAPQRPQHGEHQQHHARRRVHLVQQAHHHQPNPHPCARTTPASITCKSTRPAPGALQAEAGRPARPQACVAHLRARR
eukprot:scaffold833_cov259-Prasinococcus_capsulatus_cf.AAC.6